MAKDMTGSGGVTVNQRIRDIVRFSGLFLPLVLALYGIFFQTTSPGLATSDTIFPAIMLLWVTVGLLVFLFPAKRPNEVLLRLIAYHCCAAAYVILVSGFFIPFIAVGWLFLLLTSYLYLSKKGLLINLSALALIIVADVFVYNGDYRLILANIGSIISILTVGIFMILLTRIQQGDSEELIHTKAEEALQRDRLNTLINNLADAVISIDNKGKVQIYNAASLNLLNTNLGLEGQQIDDVIKLHDKADKPVKLFDIAKKARGMNMRDDLSLELDGECIRLEVTASPVRSSYSHARSAGSADGYVLILRDITKAKSLEEERDEFISVVSHELRTPITVMEGTLSNVRVLADRKGVSPDVIKRSLADAHEQIVFLSRMVNDLSTLSRAERGVADSAEIIDVKELLTSLYTEYAPQAEKKQLRFDLDISGQLGNVSASPLYLRELLQNFISNAIKYTKEGSITLHAKRTGKNVHIAVSDSGIGISKADQAKIFDKFYRSEDYRTRETGGTGLGLYVAAKLSKKIGTTIEVKSRLNHGSTFGFSLPSQADPASDTTTETIRLKK